MIEVLHDKLKELPLNATIDFDLEEKSITVKPMFSKYKIVISEEDDELTVTLERQPAHGTATVIDDKIAYKPLADFSGDDSFTYRVSDGKGGSDTATVTVTVVKIESDDTSHSVYLPMAIK